MTNTIADVRSQAVTDAVRATADGCHMVTLLTLTGAGSDITARPEALPGDAVTPDTVTPMLTAFARLISRHAGMFGSDIAGYAVVLPAERVAFARDRTGAGYAIQLPGKPIELRPDRWGAIEDGLTAMIEAAT